MSSGISILEPRVNGFRKSEASSVIPFPKLTDAERSARHWASVFSKLPPAQRTALFMRGRLAGRSTAEAFGRPLRLSSLGAAGNGAEQQFRDRALEFGITLPSELGTDDTKKYQRFNPENGNGRKGDGWCVYNNGKVPNGAFGNWATGVKESWVYTNGEALTEEERQERKKSIEQAERERKLEEARQHKKVAKWAGERFQELGPAPDEHPYLIQKGVLAHGLKLTSDGKLFMPLHDEHGAIHSYQTIDKNGDKRFALGGRVTGLFYQFGPPIDPKGQIHVGEGFASMASVLAAIGKTVVCAGDCGNLLAVVTALRAKYPEAEIILCADHDAWTKEPIDNPGENKALAAALAVRGKVAVPEFAGLRVKGQTDFNDLHAAEGLDAVRRCIALAKAPSNPEAGAKAADWDKFLEEVAAAPGIVFKAETVKALAALKVEDRAAFEALRLKLKELGVRVMELDKAIATEERASAAQQPKPDPKEASGEDYTEAGTKGRAYVRAPYADDELTPIMQLLDKELSTDELVPPMRSMSGWPVEVELREPHGLHELTAAGSNDDEAQQSRLPPPKTYIIARHNQCSMALLIERYIEFWKKLENGDIVPKRLAGCFVLSYLEYDKSELPKVGGLMTMPLVLTDGKLLASNGLDRKLKTVFCIEPEIVRLLPRGKTISVSEGQIKEAMRFLTDEWFADVPTTYAGKCTLIALALSVLERQLFGERPAFFITAGKRGTGKTTAATMIALALTGKRAAASAWSPQEEERRKAVFAALLQSVPMIVWDNIKLGTTISCPTIEKVLTSVEIEDRVLGESRNERASCATIQVFTGNNIVPKGDMASRSLNIRLDTERPDPENRKFAHPDIFEWTLARRGEIIKALYTVLLGNPRFHQPLKERDAPKTRFKQWWHLVGAPIEHAAELIGETIDFGKMFLDVEADDEDSATLAEVLDILGRKSSYKPFKASTVSLWLDGTDDDANTLNDFFATAGSTRRDAKPSAKSIGKRLKANIEAPVLFEKGVTLTLHKEKNEYDNSMDFYIKRDVTLF